MSQIYNPFLKRVFDILGSILFLPFLIITLLVLLPLNYFFDKGSIFYNAERVGFKGQFFRMFKFRTMIVDAPDVRLPDGSTYNGDDDPRITRIGKILRKTSIDELPQILNVLYGDMSFIGPRPDPIDWLERYSDEEKIVLSVKPGITGYNQAYFRNSADGALKLKNDMYYAQNISFLFDVKIFFRTFKTIFLRENVNIDKSRLKVK